ncbi:hypothetical protein DOS48_14545 (plasmid) [Halorubrum sp. PV6]|nr:hypothetical protein DOS48_14545 [Halorubrum sp. PV6]
MLIPRGTRVVYFSLYAISSISASVVVADDFAEFAEDLVIEIGDSVVVERYEDEIAIRPVEE